MTKHERNKQKVLQLWREKKKNGMRRNPYGISIETGINLKEVYQIIRHDKESNKENQLQIAKTRATASVES